MTLKSTRPLLEFVATRCEKRGLIAAYFSTGALDPENHPNWRTRPQEPINDEPMHAKIAPHTCYIFLHDTSRPTDFPTRKSTQLQRYLQLRASKWGGIVNWTYVPESPVVESPYSKDAETRAATVFSMLGGRLEIPRLSLENLDEVEERLKAHLQGPLTPDTFEEAHIYVCTHGARDCRCGHIGGDVVAALEQELKKRREEDPGSLASRVTVRETAHVGGHKFAANALVFPHGEWYVILASQFSCANDSQGLVDSRQKMLPP